MNKATKLVLCITALGMALLFFVLNDTAQSDSGVVRDRITFRRSATILFAERADSPEKRAQGLMHRSSLGKDEGMIFYFEESGFLSFWMHNTPIPLTIIFLNENRRVVDIQDMAPCLEKDAELCRIYTSRKSAKYAIEVNQGFVSGHGIALGDYVTIRSGR